MKKILFILLALMLVVSVAVVGCAPAEEEEPTGPQGTLVTARASLAKETFLPWTGGAIEKMYLSGTIYESLTLRNKLGDVLPCLATNWEMSADGKNWTVTIREGIPFHDATGKVWGNLTAEDVKYTFERIASNGTNTWPAYPVSVSHIASTLQGVLGPNITAAIEVVNNYTVKFKLVRADIAFMKTCTGPDMMGVVCKSYVVSKGDEVAAANPVGTGPYVKDSQVVGSYIQLRAVDNWADHWRMGALPNPTKYFKYIKFVIVPEVSARALGLMAGDYHMAELSPEVVAQVRADPNCVVLPDIEYVSATDLVRLGGLNQLDTNPHTPPDPVPRYNPAAPWANNTTVGTKTAGQLVRQALNLAINRTAILNTIYEGVGGLAVASLSIPEWLTTLTPYPYNPTLAESYLDSAGYPRSAPGVKDRFSVTILADERYSNKLVALAVESYWEAVGIDVTVTDILWSALRTRWLMGGNTTGNLAGTKDGINYAWVHRTPPAAADPALTINMAFDPGAVLGDYTEATINALRLAMLGELNPTLRTQKVKDLGAYIHDKACQVFLVSIYTPLGFRKELAEPRDLFDLKENAELIRRV